MKKLLLTLSLLAAAASAQTFETATVRPAPPNSDPSEGYWSLPNTGQFKANHLPLTVLLQLAYGIDKSQIANQPVWLNTALYDLVAKPEPGIKLTREELKPRLQALLRERFHLVAHRETRNLRGYALTISKAGPHLTPATAGHSPNFNLNTSTGHMEGVNWSTSHLARMLTAQAGFPVVDETHLDGSYDISFTFNPNPDPTTDSTQPPLPQALQHATGLELRSKIVPVETVVIDSVDKTPTEN